MQENIINYKVVAKGYYGFCNLGDDALMITLHDILTEIYNNEQIAYLCNNADYLNNLIPGLNIVQNNENTKFRTDIKLYGGGTQFFSFYKKNNFNKIKENEYNLFLRKIIRKAFQSIFTDHGRTTDIKYKRLAAIGIGVGPFEDLYVQKKTESLFRKMNFISVRDEKSYKLCQAWNIRNVSFRSDICYYPSFKEKYIKSDIINRSVGVNRICVIVRDWTHDRKGNAYKDSLFSVIQKLRAIGIDLDIVLFGGNTDKAWIDLIRRYGMEFLAWDPHKETISSFINCLSKYDLFITARYHGAVFASLLGKPCVCIGIEQKLEMMAELLGVGARLWRYPFEANDCVDAVTSINNSYTETAEAIRSVVERQQKLAMEMVNEFIKFCKTNNKD